MGTLSNTHTHMYSLSLSHTHTHTHTHTHAQSRVRPTEPKPSDFDVIAMYDYPGLERGDLPLVKGQRVTVFDATREFWWRARDEHG